MEQAVVEPAAAQRRAGTDLGVRPAVWWAALIVGFALQVAWRLHLSLPLTGPIAHGDEDGYLLGARVLAGGPAATLPAWSIMRPMGYPLLLAPIYWFVQEPEQVYAGVHIVDAALMASTFPLLYLLARRLFEAPRGLALALAFVLATLPSLVFFGEFALTDALLPELLLVLLLAMHAMVAGRRPIGAGLVAGATAGYAANTHVRGLVMLVVLVAVVGLGWYRRWLPRTSAVATLAAAGTVYVAGRRINSWLEHQLFPTGAVSVDGRVADRLTSPTGLMRVLCDGAGQIWHLCTSTYGLAALGIAAAALALLRREGSRPTRIVLGAGLAMTAGIAFATAAGIPDEGRVNNHVYGRYVALFAGFWALVAVNALTRASWRRAALLVAVAAGLVMLTLGAVLAWAGHRLPGEIFVNFDAPELSFLSGDYRALHLYRMTGFAFGFMVLFAAAFTGWHTVRRWSLPGSRPSWTVSRRRWGPRCALVGLLVLNLVAMVSITNNISAAWADQQYHPGPRQLVRDANVAPGSTVAEASNLPWNVNQRHQREVYWRALASFDPGTGAPPDDPTYVVTLASRSGAWNGARYGYAAVLRCRESKSVTWVVWRRR